MEGGGQNTQAGRSGRGRKTTRHTRVREREKTRALSGDTLDDTDVRARIHTYVWRVTRGTPRYVSLVFNSRALHRRSRLHRWETDGVAAVTVVTAMMVVAVVGRNMKTEYLTYGVLPFRARKRRSTRDGAPRGKKKRKTENHPPLATELYRRAVTASITSGTAFERPNVSFDDRRGFPHARTHAQRNKLTHTHVRAHAVHTGAPRAGLLYSRLDVVSLLSPIAIGSRP